MTADHDGGGRRVRVVYTERKKPRSANAEAAARYRARMRGEDVPTRKPGPKPKTITDQRTRIGELEGRVRELENLLRIAQDRLARRTSTLTVEQLAGEPLTMLDRDPPEHDRPERKVLLADLRVALEDRHDQWPK